MTNFGRSEIVEEGISCSEDTMSSLVPSPGYDRPKEGKLLGNMEENIQGLDHVDRPVPQPCDEVQERGVLYASTF